VGAFAGLAQVVHGTTRDDLTPMTHERVDDFLEVQQPRLAVDQGNHVDAEDRFHRRLFVEIVEDDLGVFVALEFDDDAHAVLVGLVAQFRDALDQLATHEVGDALEQARLVHLVGQLGDDDGLAAVVIVFLDVCLGAHDDTAATGRIGVIDLTRAVDDAGRRKIRARHEFHEFRNRDRRVVDDRDTGVDDLDEVVRRDIRGHADRDPRRAVHEQVRHPGGQYRGLGLGLVVVRNEIDGFFIDVGEQFAGQPGHAHFGVTHRRWCIAVDRTEVALAVDQQVAHRERLRHAHDRVVHGSVAVRMVFTDHVADDACRLLVRAIPLVAKLAHRVQHSAVDGLEPVTDVGQGAAHDHAHRVIEIGLLHLVFEIDVQEFAGDFGHGIRLSFSPCSGRC
jgi:hypothetical protein